MAITWEQAMFQKWYSMPNGQGGTTTYSRIGYRFWRGRDYQWFLEGQTVEFPDHPMNEMRWRVEHLVSAFGIQPNDRVLVLGCALGLLPETFIWWKKKMGVPEVTAQSQVAGVDNSQWVQGNIAEEAHPLMAGKIVNRDLRLGAGNAQMRGSLRAAAGNSEFFDWIITESVIESYTDAEQAAFLTACESYQRNTGTAQSNLARVIHMVFEDYPPGRGWDPVPDGGAPNRSLEAWSQVRPAHSWISCVGSMHAIAGTG